VVLEEVAVPITLVGPLPAENQLHRGIDQECVYQGSKFDFAGLSGVPMFVFESVSVYRTQRPGQSGKCNIGSGLI